MILVDQHRKSKSSLFPRFTIFPESCFQFPQSYHYCPNYLHHRSKDWHWYWNSGPGLNFPFSSMDRVRVLCAQRIKFMKRFLRLLPGYPRHCYHPLPVWFLWGHRQFLFSWISWLPCTLPGKPDWSSREWTRPWGFPWGFARSHEYRSLSTLGPAKHSQSRWFQWKAGHSSTGSTDTLARTSDRTHDSVSCKLWEL